MKKILVTYQFSAETPEEIKRTIAELKNMAGIVPVDIDFVPKDGRTNYRELADNNIKNILEEIFEE